MSEKETTSSTPTGVLTWSVMIPYFNEAEYLHGLIVHLQCEFQGRDDVEIVVCDDHSDMKSAADALAGFDDVRFRIDRAETNLGPIRNFNRALALARGDLVHILHADDAIRPNFYRRIEEVYRDPGIDAVISRVVFFDQYDNWISVSKMIQMNDGMVTDQAIETMAIHNEIFFPAVTLRRSSLAKIGEFDVRLLHCADWEFWVRLMQRGKVFILNEPLALYRHHPGSDTSRLIRTGENVEDVRRALGIITQRFSSRQCRRLATAGSTLAFEDCMVEIDRAQARRDWQTLRNQSWQALRTRCTLLGCLRILGQWLKVLRR